MTNVRLSRSMHSRDASGKRVAALGEQDGRILSRAHRSRLGALRKTFDELEELVSGRSADHREIEKMYREFQRTRGRLTKNDPVVLD